MLAHDCEKLTRGFPISIKIYASALVVRYLRLISSMDRKNTAKITAMDSNRNLLRVVFDTGTSFGPTMDTIREPLIVIRERGQKRKHLTQSDRYLERMQAGLELYPSDRIPSSTEIVNGAHRKRGTNSICNPKSRRKKEKYPIWKD